MKAVWTLLKESALEWSNDGASTLAAALAYYTIFALAPLLIIVISVAGLVFGQGQAQQELLDQITQAVGSDAAGIIRTMLTNTAQSGSGILGTIIGFAILIVGATGLFAQLQNALNKMWNVKPKPSAGILHMLMVRVLSLGMVLVIGFLLLVSLVLSAALSVVSNYFNGLLPGGDTFWQIVNFIVSTGIITLLFALIFKYLPDVKIAWRDVWVGAFVTALLFALGKFLIGFYIGTSSASSTYGAAGSLVVLLLWIYYSAQILLFGAEFTQVYGRHYGSRIQPAEHAERMGGAPSDGTDNEQADQAQPGKAQSGGAKTYNRSGKRKTNKKRSQKRRG